MWRVPLRATQPGDEAALENTVARALGDLPGGISDCVLKLALSKGAQVYVSDEQRREPLGSGVGREVPEMSSHESQNYLGNDILESSAAQEMP